MLTGLVPPPEAHDPEAWMAGYRQRVAHRPAGGSTVCPVCLRPWHCGPYREAIAAMIRATTVLEQVGRPYGVARVPTAR